MFAATFDTGDIFAPMATMMVTSAIVTRSSQDDDGDVQRTTTVTISSDRPSSTDEGQCP